MRYTTAVPTAVLALLFTAACDSPEKVSGVAGKDASLAASPATPQGRPFNSDDEFARVARAEVPGFAGFYLDADGTPVIRLKDQNQRGAAQRYLAREMAAARRGRLANAPQQPVFRAAAYDFAELHGWSEQLHPLLDRDDVFTLDVDEVGNRVRVGVADDAAANSVRGEAARLGVPASALEVEKQPRPQVRATLLDKFTTLNGGVQIAFGQYVCTLGFNARRASNNASVFVTNSHCTTTYFGTDGSTLYQPSVLAGNAIGAEVADRGNYACAGTGTSCRRADAAYVSHNGTRTVGQGGITRTAWATGGRGGLTTTGEYDIVARYTGSAPVGTYLDKTGRTSGTTYGQVTSSCVTIDNLRCQDISKIWSEGGDSGSPVYVYLGGSGTAENDVQLYGVMWGGPGSDYTTTYSSRLSGIEQDLGALNSLCRPGLGC